MRNSPERRQVLTGLTAAAPPAVLHVLLRSSRSVLLFAALCADAVVYNVAAAALSSPSQLAVSANARWLVNADGRPVFLLADTAWSLALRVNREDAEAYLRKRRDQGFNAVTFLLFAPGKNELTSGLANAYGDTPFELTGGRPDPTRPVLTPGSDASNREAYDYWDHVDYIVATARGFGLYTLILPTWGTGVVGTYAGVPDDGVVFDVDNARTYGRWLGQRYRNEPHVIWMMGGDRSAVNGDRDSRPVFRAMAAAIAEAAPRHLISYHPRKAAPQSAEWFHDDPWLAFNSIQEWPDQQLRHIAQDWGRTPTKPTWLFEGRYEGYWKANYNAADWGEWQIRQQAYQTVFAGAFGHTYGHERVFGFGQDGVNWKDHLDAAGARSMTHLAKFMNAFGPADLLARVPDQSLLDGEHGKAERVRSNRITAMRTTDGRQAMFYTANGRTIRVRMDRLSTGRFFAYWFNPRTGRWHAGETDSAERKFFARDLRGGSGAEPREFAPPSQGDGEDWVLLLDSRDRG